MSVKSIGTMLTQLSGLLGTKDLNNWEQDFVENNFDKFKEKGSTTWMSDTVVDIIDKLYNKHFS